MSTGAAKLQKSKNHALFISHNNNRPLHNIKLLMKSMQQHGFLKSRPIQVRRTKSGKYEIISGHHRFAAAMALGIEVYFIVDDAVADPAATEAPGIARQWSLADFVFYYAGIGDVESVKVVDFIGNHGWPVSIAVNICAGCIHGHAKVKQFSEGKYIACDIEFAERIARVTDHLRYSGVAFATKGAFIRALAMCMRVPEFDEDRFLLRLSKYPNKVEVQNYYLSYLEIIETVYNHGKKTDRIPVKFRAVELSRARQLGTDGSHKNGAAKKALISKKKKAVDVMRSGATAATR